MSPILRKRGLHAGLIVVAGVLIGFLAYSRYVLVLGLRDQAALVRFPPQIQASAVATRALAIQLNGVIDAQVPFHQRLQVPLHGRYRADVALDTQVPLHLLIRYRGRVPIHAVAQVSGTTDLVFHSALLPKFPLKFQVPLDFQQPVSLTVPVDTVFHFVYRGPVSVTFDQTLDVPVDTVLHTALKVDRQVDAPILARFGLLLRLPSTPLPLIVTHSDLQVPLASLRLQRRVSATDVSASGRQTKGNADE